MHCPPHATRHPAHLTQTLFAGAQSMQQMVTVGSVVVNGNAADNMSDAAKEQLQGKITQQQDQAYGMLAGMTTSVGFLLKITQCFT